MYEYKRIAGQIERFPERGRGWFVKMKMKIQHKKKKITHTHTKEQAKVKVIDIKVKSLHPLTNPTIVHWENIFSINREFSTKFSFFFHSCPQNKLSFLLSSLTKHVQTKKIKIS